MLVSALRSYHTSWWFLKLSFGKTLISPSFKTIFMPFLDSWILFNEALLQKMSQVLWLSNSKKCFKSSTSKLAKTCPVSELFSSGLWKVSSLNFRFWSLASLNYWKREIKWIWNTRHIARLFIFLFFLLFPFLLLSPHKLPFSISHLILTYK